MQELLEEIRNSLKEKGYKITQPREKVLDIIIKNQYKHLTSDEIYVLIKKDYPKIGISTVYRTMQLLERINIVCKFDSDEEGIRYELMEPNDKYQHPHLICKNCNKVYPVKDINLEQIKNKIDKNFNLKIIDYSLKFYGICKNCSKL
ncbi:ferric uptake regulator family protein [Clostridium argentinense CDC 2741]|uniref:Ferric uptake regulator family protein n=1 Tax=Clostridium argentinense CDC 2741 TaxID=1418104 RepID=A0A0C1QZ92_9CLOT|nr:Fur family transcriptional regulator [Clostridium argentinense]ARC85957.1 transcriptional repressor [Clostridium argentinense]KIE46422.1 ferric uptake regulator family protein [Clostridium argentinense CDC 2741]NFF38889.1 transcriptional repressor [Clostridium argentinense]NFP48681.1 transcriptional repressor [Clostridium argentinense]NFP71051.1 transcriptional repressor [Clostridium argentinense]